MANVIEEAKSGRAACRTCKKPIAKGELRLGIETPNQFGDTPSMQWHHLPCAATKLPVELEDALKSYAGEVPDRDALTKAMTDAIAKGKAKPGGLPHAERAPTGRAKCMQCKQPIDQATMRVAVERELEAGAMVQSGAGYLHPACAAAYLDDKGIDKPAFLEQLRANSRVPPEELDNIMAQVAGT